MHRRIWTRVALLQLTAVTASLLAPAGRAQSHESDERTAVESKTDQLPDFRFPTNRQNLRTHLKNTFGVRSSFEAAFIAGVHQSRNSLPEWGQGAQGYGRRLASQFGRSVIKSGIEFGLESVLHQDASYRRCECAGFLRRVGHALVSDFVARKRDGSPTFSFVKAAGYYGGAMIATSWYPGRYRAEDGIRLGTISLAFGAGSNVVREFWPQLRSLFRKPAVSDRR